MRSTPVPDDEQHQRLRWVIMCAQGAYWTGRIWAPDLQQAKAWVNPSAAQAEALRLRGWVQIARRKRRIA